MADGRYEDAVVRIVQWSAGMPTAGLGLLVGPREVVTCAHVVNAALGKPPRTTQQPGEEERVMVEFPFLGGRPTRQGRVAAWLPPPAAAGLGPDVAGLTLTEDVPSGAIPARFASSRPEIGASLRVYGYPSKPPRPDGASVSVELKGEVASGLLQIDSRSDQTIKAQPGFSGSPVWDDAAHAAAGLLTGTALVDEAYADAYMVPAALVARTWEEQFDYLLIPPNPYRGLEPFTAEQKHDFFGRDEDVARLAELVRSHAMVAVVGASGVGKSSLVRAGLLPLLEREQRRSVALLRPGQDPWERLANSLIRAEHDTLGSGSADESRRMVERLRQEGLASIAHHVRSEERPLVVVIDQFEELFAGDRPPDPALLDLLIPEPGRDDGGHGSS